MYFRRGNGVFCIFKLFFHDPQGTFTSDRNSSFTRQSFLLAKSRFNVYRGNQKLGY